MKMQAAFKYCLRCGHEARSDQNKLSCGNCGLDFYFNPKACTGMILKNDKGKILLVERAVNPKKGYWDTPGGFVEENETFEECTIREAKEELGIEIENLKYLGSMLDVYEFQGIEYTTLGVMFEAAIKDLANIKPADDVAGYKFFKPAELPYERFAFAWMEKFFKSYI
jgi:NAD+ diphosphatase